MKTTPGSQVALGNQKQSFATNDLLWLQASMSEDKSDEMRPEYRREDLGEGVRGKYLEAYRAGTNLVLLSPDVAKVFPTEDLVNEALRNLIKVAQKSVRPPKPNKRRETG